MRRLLIGFVAVSAIALAQTPPPATVPPAAAAPPAAAPPAVAAPQDAKPATAVPTAAAVSPAAAATSPVPSSEAIFTGWIDFGYTWRSDVAGSVDTYRSLVNLGSGPKLLGAEFTLTDPKHRLFDQI